MALIKQILDIPKRTCFIIASKYCLLINAATSKNDRSVKGFAFHKTSPPSWSAHIKKLPKTTLIRREDLNPRSTTTDSCLLYRRARSKHCLSYLDVSLAYRIKALFKSQWTLRYWLLKKSSYTKVHDVAAAFDRWNQWNILIGQNTHNFFCLETHLAKNGTSSWFNVGPNARLTSLLCRLLHHLTRFVRFNSVSASVGPASAVAAPATRWLGSEQARQISYKMPRVHFLKNLLNNTVAGFSKKGLNVRDVEGLICWLVPEVMTCVTY